MQRFTRLADLLVLGGLGCSAFGAWQLSPAAGLVVIGISVAAAGIALAIKRGQAP